MRPARPDEKAPALGYAFELDPLYQALQAPPVFPQTLGFTPSVG